MADSILASMAIRIAANTVDLKRGLNDASNQFKTFSSQIQTLAGTFGVAFGAREVARFTAEIIKLAGEAEGVKNAFDRLPDSVKVMGDLKKATGGTVSELELMKNAVQANNFQIPIQNLSRLFQFATLRAQQTGQSVDYLVQSIILGIGRKSPLILDNLGISAVRLREKLKGVSTEAATVGDVAKVVGDIAEEELSNMAGFSENASTKIQRLSASWDNLKVAMGQAATAGGVVGDLLDAATTIINSFDENASKDFLVKQSLLAQSIKAESIPAIEKLTAELQALRNEFGVLADNTAVLNMARAFKLSDEQAARFFATMQKINGEVKATKVEFVKPGQEQTLNSLQAKLKQLNEEFESINITDRKSLVTKGQQIIAIDAQIKKLEKLRKANESYGNNLNGLNKKLSELNERFSKTDANDKGKLNSIGQRIVAIQALIRELESLKNIDEDILTKTPTPKTVGTAPTNLTGAEVYGNARTALVDLDKQLESINARAQKTKQVHIEVAKQIQKVWVETASMISSAISSIAFEFGRGIAGAKDFGQGILKAIIGFAQQFGEILVSLGFAAKAAQGISVDPDLAIIAGIALLALAGAASQALDSSQDSYNSGSARNQNSNYKTNWKDSIHVEVGGEVEIRGDRLIYIINRQTQLNGRTRG